MIIDLYATQEAIEKQQRSNTIKRFVNDLKKKTEKGDETSSYYGASLMKRAIEPMVLSRFSSGLFRAMFAMKEICNGNEIHRRVSA